MILCRRQYLPSISVDLACYYLKRRGMRVVCIADDGIGIGRDSSLGGERRSGTRKHTHAAQRPPSTIIVTNLSWE